MFRYLFLSYIILLVVVIFSLPRRGELREKQPLEVFFDMDRQDKVKPQTSSNIFADGMAARKPVTGTIPFGYNPNSEYQEISFANHGQAKNTDNSWKTAIPFEQLNIRSAQERNYFLRLGKEMFVIHCSACHGISGDGQGPVAKRGFVGVANLLDTSKQLSAYPNGKLFDTITNGRNTMPGLKHSLTVKERWAVVYYLRLLQKSSQK